MEAVPEDGGLQVDERAAEGEAVIEVALEAIRPCGHRVTPPRPLREIGKTTHLRLGDLRAVHAEEQSQSWSSQDDEEHQGDRDVSTSARGGQRAFCLNRHQNRK